MADEVHLTKRGVQALKWDGDSEQYVEEEFPTTLYVLRSECHVDAEVTLGDIFRAVELVQFLEKWLGRDVAAFHAEARKPSDKPSDLVCIELYKHFDWNKWGRGNW